MVLKLCPHCVRTLCHFIAEKYSIACIDHILFIHSSVGGYWGCFYFGAIECSRDIHVQVLVWMYVFVYISIQRRSIY
jgi:hypothetical protein